MVIVVVSWNIEENVQKILGHSNISEDMYHIEFGEDCFFIILTGKSEIFADTIEELQQCFNTQTIVIKIEDGNIVLHCDKVVGCPVVYV